MKCTECRDCTGFSYNPERIVGPRIGSRNAQTAVYFNKEKTQVVCGCFVGTMEEFKTAVDHTHGDTLYGLNYKKFISIAETVISAFREFE